ncbi:ion transporter [Martelella mediterranea]|uniref:MlotiK1 channel n=1 Tax=Martelella mediterranea DSM 17316 TaxID=1122214 RepID=A0A1U9Z3F7_9HYPH|nr:ion transporter [Martelella mediterranea]AQZ52233.1 MlotiK1 channel [Martelella mediterranea DSM 17316]
MMNRFRARAYQLLEFPSRVDRPSWLIELLLILLIIISVIAVCLETVPDVLKVHGPFLMRVDLWITVIFTIEYATRLWAAAEAYPELPAWKARLKWAISPMALIDLVAILPFWLAFVVPIDFRLLRLLRLLRIYKLARYSPALTALFAVIREEAGTLFAALIILAILLVFAASGAWLVEREVQPEAFGSIPSAMWWALVTLTTVGYGDVVPHTVIGRLFGGLITLLGVGMAALPAGIIATGLAQHLHERRNRLCDEFREVLQDGRLDLADGRRVEALRRELGISRTAVRSIYEEVQREQPPRQCRCPKCDHVFSPPR